jgi:hypothetical protein
MGLADLDAWKAHAPFLAGELPDSAHVLVAETCVKVGALVAGATRLQGTDAAELSDEQVQQIVVPLLEMIREAQMALAPYAYPTADPSMSFFTAARRG